MEGDLVLREYDGALGLTLWQAVRDVVLWGTADPGARGALFAPGAGPRRRALYGVMVADRLAEPLEALATLVAAPGAIDSDSLCRACLRIASWAEGDGSCQTAIAFAQAAAVCAPGRADAALEIGRLAAAAGDASRAETWFRRAVGIARRNEDRQMYARAYLGIGSFRELSGDLTGARRAFLRAARTARRHGLRETRGGAAHALLRVCARDARYDEAESWGRVASSNLGRENARMPEVLRDLARLWIQRGDWGRALKTLEKLLRTEDDPDVRMMLLALTVRAVAARRDRFEFGDVWWKAWELVQDRPASAARERAAVDLAHAAAAMEDRPRALGLVGSLSTRNRGVTRWAAIEVDQALAALGVSLGTQCDARSE